MLRTLVLRPTLGQGGADRVTGVLLNSLARSRFELTLGLARAQGPFLATVPEDVAVCSLGETRLLRCIPALSKLLAELRPDVVVSTSSGMNPIATAAHVLVRSRSALVLSERSRRSRSSRIRSALEIALKRLLYRRAEAVIAVSNGIAEEVITSYGVSRERVFYVPNPLIEDKVFEQAEVSVDHPWFGDGQVPPLLAVGRLVAQKDYPVLLRALQHLRSTSAPSARLVILGEGPLHAQLEKLASELGIAEVVSFAGFDPNPFRYMSRCSAFVLSSCTEGMPGVLIQAMACGAAVVSTNCDFGPADLIEHGRSGLLVPVGDHHALAGAIGAVLSDHSLRERLSAAARVRVAEFEVEPATAQYERVISWAVESRRRRLVK